jgi:hypothetical protein
MEGTAALKTTTTSSAQYPALQQYILTKVCFSVCSICKRAQNPAASSAGFERNGWCEGAYVVLSWLGSKRPKCTKMSYALIKEPKTQLERLIQEMPNCHGSAL